MNKIAKKWFVDAAKDVARNKELPSCTSLLIAIPNKYGYHVVEWYEGLMRPNRNGISPYWLDGHTKGYSEDDLRNLRVMLLLFAGEALNGTYI
jgi:hypothetical protein